jgi:hypothetical protein
MGNVDSNHLLQFVLIIGLLASIGANLVMMFVTLSNRKQRREVSFTADYATRGELEEVKQDVEALADESRRENAAIRAKMESDKLTIIAAGEQRAAGLYERMDETRRELTAKIDSVPANVISTLKQTGAIK